MAQAYAVSEKWSDYVATKMITIILGFRQRPILGSRKTAAQVQAALETGQEVWVSMHPHVGTCEEALGCQLTLGRKGVQGVGQNPCLYIESVSFHCQKEQRLLGLNSKRLFYYCYLLIAYYVPDTMIVLNRHSAEQSNVPTLAELTLQ